MSQVLPKNTHIPVLLKEVVDAFKGLQSKSPKNLVVIDATLGGGGHSAAIINLAKSLKSKKVSFELMDLDPEAIEHLKARIGSIGEPQEANQQANFNELSLDFRQQNFRLPPSTSSLDAAYFILADLGLSQNQLDKGRGFSYKSQAPLDMRLDDSLAVTAAELLNMLPLKQLTKVFLEYGQLALAEELAKLIVRRRNTGFYIRTTTDFNQVLRALNIDNPKQSAKAYQALRIAVNTELENLKEFLTWSTKLIESRSGIVVVITFHSLEQSTLVRFCKSQKLNLKIIKPSAAELKANPRSRSAILNLVTIN